LLHAIHAPPPAARTIEDRNDACFIVKDHGGQALAYVLLRRRIEFLCTSLRELCAKVKLLQPVSCKSA
jgi:hypothetical protein